MAIFHITAAAIALFAPIRTSARAAPGSAAEAAISDSAIGFTLREDLATMSLEDTVSQCAPPPVNRLARPLAPCGKCLAVCTSACMPDERLYANVVFSDLPRASCPPIDHLLTYRPL